LSFDDWGFHYYGLQLPPPPATGQGLRYQYDELLITNPLSLFKPASLLTVIVLSIILWNLFEYERLWVRFLLSLLMLVGFPYLGHIGPWNMAASEYFVSVCWVILWINALKIAHHQQRNFFITGVWLLILSFLAACWFEVWLISYSAVTLYLMLNSFLLQRKEGLTDHVRREWIISTIVCIGYILAVFYYTRGGPEKFIDGKHGKPGDFMAIMDGARFVHMFLLAAKECIVLLKDWLPVVFLLLYVRLKGEFKSRVESDFGMFVFWSLGVFLFMYICTFITGSPQWRVRFICLLPLTMALYALPNTFLNMAIDKMGLTHLKTRLRYVFLMIAIGGLVYNAYFTYYANNIDVIGWLKFRDKVNAHDMVVLTEPCCEGFRIGHPSDAVHWPGLLWGAQDNRYRYFNPPSDVVRNRNIQYWWESHGM
jgi:hypothetical protein